MRQAKQTKANELAFRATGMVSDRSMTMAKKQNEDTNSSVERSLHAVRNMNKDHALESTVMIRQNRVNEDVIETKTPKKFVSGPTKEKIPQVDESSLHKTSSHRHFQPDPRTLGQDSITPGVRRAMQKNPNAQLPKKNPEDPRLLTQTAKNDGMKALTQNEIRKTMVAHGISSNPVEDARRRKQLDNKIRELAARTF